MHRKFDWSSLVGFVPRTRFLRTNSSYPAMFSYDSAKQAYSFSLFEETKAAPTVVDPQKQEAILLSDFNIIQEADFHDLWFCEHQFCENSFWFGGKHHCRRCGVTICTEHGVQNVVLSTKDMPVIVDKLPNAKNPILAASKDKLPENLEFKWACLKCCETAKPKAELTEEEKRAKAERRANRAEEKQKKTEEAEANHWSKDEALLSKMQALKAKKEARKPLRLDTQESSLPQDEHKPEERAAAVTFAEPSPAAKCESTEVVAASPRGGIEETKSASPRSTTAAGAEAKPTFASKVAFSPRAVKRDVPATEKTAQAETAGRLLVTVKTVGGTSQVSKSGKRSQAEELLERAAAQLAAAKNVEEAAREAKAQRLVQQVEEQSLEDAQSEEAALAGTLSPEELALYTKQQEVIRAEEERQELELQLLAAQTSAAERMAAMMMQPSRAKEEAEVQAALRVQQDAIRNVLSESTFLILRGIAVRKAFERALYCEEDNYEVLATAAKEFILYAWRFGLSYRRRQALLRARQLLVETHAVRRIQRSYRALLAHRRTATARNLRDSLQRAASHTVDLRKQERRLKRAQLPVLYDLCLARAIARFRFRRRLAKLQRVLVIDSVAVTSSYSSQQVVITKQEGLQHMPLLPGPARNAVLSASHAVSMYKTKENTFASNAVCHELCFVPNVTLHSNVVATLINPNCFVQVRSLIVMWTVLLVVVTVTMCSLCVYFHLTYIAPVPCSA
jgi:hypothetical protein